MSAPPRRQTGPALILSSSRNRNHARIFYNNSPESPPARKPDELMLAQQAERLIVLSARTRRELRGGGSQSPDKGFWSPPHLRKHKPGPSCVLSTPAGKAKSRARETSDSRTRTDTTLRQSTSRRALNARVGKTVSSNEKIAQKPRKQPQLALGEIVGKLLKEMRGVKGLLSRANRILSDTTADYYYSRTKHGEKKHREPMVAETSTVYFSVGRNEAASNGSSRSSIKAKISAEKPLVHQRTRTVAGSNDKSQLRTLASLLVNSKRRTRNDPQLLCLSSPQAGPGEGVIGQLSALKRRLKRVLANGGRRICMLEAVKSAGRKLP